MFFVFCFAITVIAFFVCLKSTLSLHSMGAPIGLPVLMTLVVGGLAGFNFYLMMTNV